ncbi:hypothetical protein DAPPUDRAFT_115191 [Daphnia pulex]|uniref:Uncharacterized protein n=1 Tax=Daphnia pulex TaxID=6669 RepID=E9HKJ6_DAPPU|nr:hypothetical protein DAPPUDRAFT_115191 [Daphnia pulex]|eukprot:EFX67731.1 hypothetical protein DAPPUDRAFT_115191 [Daphnia pulex]
MTTAVQQKTTAGMVLAEQQRRNRPRGEDNGRTATRKTGRVEDIGRTAKREHGNTAAKTGNGTEGYQAGDDDEMTAGTMGRLSRSMHHKMLDVKLKHKFYWPTL